MDSKESSKLGMISGVYIPVCLNIMSILMFLRFGLILGQIGFLGVLGLLVTAYGIDLLTTLSLSAIASNGEVKGGGAYYLISRSLGPEFGGSIGILFFLAQALNTAMNIVGLLDCIRLNIGAAFPHGYWISYALQTAALLLCTCMCLLGSAVFSKASNILLAILTIAVVSIPASAILKAPFSDENAGIEYTGLSLGTLAGNFLPHHSRQVYRGASTFRDLFGILFPATSGIFAGASMSGDLRSPSQAIPKGTLWAMLTTFIVYFVVVLSMACTISRDSLLANANIVSLTNLSQPIILAGECAVTLFSALMGILGSAKLLQALARDKLIPGLSVFGRGTRKTDEPILSIVMTYVIAQVALLADLNQIATFISMGYQMTFFVMNLACFLLKIGSAPNFRPSFKFFTWQTACLGSISSALAMFFIDETYAAIAICILIFVFMLIHYSCPPKRWGDVSQNLIYHQVRKYLLRLKAEHIKFWRPHILLLINDPRRQTRLIRFCNSLKKGSLYILGHVIVTDDFDAGVREARLQQQAWTRYISEVSRIKAFIQLTMSPSITWGVRNLVLSAGLGGMRPNIAVLGFYNMNELRKVSTSVRVPDLPASPASKMNRRQSLREEKKGTRRRRGDTSARLLEDVLPTDEIRTEGMLSPTDYMIMLEDLALKYKLNVAVAHGFEELETPRADGTNTKKYIDLWPIQMSAEISTEGRNALTTNMDTYTLILQLGHILSSVRAWHKAFSVRIMVFVEYEDEVEEERARVRALLEKLRIDAMVLVFHLASGFLNTYELIINGKTGDIDTEIIVSEALRGQAWWEDLQELRRQAEDLSSNQEVSQLAHYFDTGAIGGYNPHDEASVDRRRQQNHIGTKELPRKSDIATISRLGVSMGIHTTRINDDVLRESRSDEGSSSDTDSTTDDEIYDLGLDEQSYPSRSPWAEATGRHHPHPTSMTRETATEHESSFLQMSRSRAEKSAVAVRTTPLSYGTLSRPNHSPAQSRNSIEAQIREGRGAETGSPPKLAALPGDSRLELFPDLGPSPPHELPANRRRRSQSMGSFSFTTNQFQMRDHAAPHTPLRPGFSRRSSGVRFSNHPGPEPRITVEDESNKISFAISASIPATPRPDRPTFSRQSSLGIFSSRPLPETRVSGEEGARTITFAHQPTNLAPSAGARARHHSRQGSQYSQLGQEVFAQATPEPSGPGAYDCVEGDAATDGGSTSSGQETMLSFNDLPSRAQHLILNELMQTQSRDTAVLMSTLPIPSEGTSLDELSTVQYLSDVELLCHGLPPMLMVLSNSMTMTVNL